MNIIDRIKYLPEEIQKKIYDYYYTKIYFNEVIHPFQNTLFMMEQINKYITYHAIHHMNVFCINLQQHHYDYSKYNNYLEKIYKDYSLNRFLLHSHNFSENIRYFNLILSSNIIRKIRKRYQYFCAYVIALIANPIYSTNNYHRTLDFFTNLS